MKIREVGIMLVLDVLRPHQGIIGIEIIRREMRMCLMIVGLLIRGLGCHLRGLRLFPVRLRHTEEMTDDMYLVLKDRHSACMVSFITAPSVCFLMLTGHLGLRCYRRSMSDIQ